MQNSDSFTMLGISRDLLEFNKIVTLREVRVRQ